jgi:transposase
MCRRKARVPADHPLRAIRVYADEALRRMSRVFNRMYADGGRMSVPPETLLKSTLLMALRSVRSERLFCEMLEYNLLFRWFLGLGIDEAVFDTAPSARTGSGCWRTGWHRACLA